MFFRFEQKRGWPWAAAPQESRSKNGLVCMSLLHKYFRQSNFCEPKKTGDEVRSYGTD